MLEALSQNGLQVDYFAHANAILTSGLAEVAGRLESALLEATIPVEEIFAPGAGRNERLSGTM